MAMRGRGGRVNPIRPPRLIPGRVYEQFKPMSEWRQEDDYGTLLLYLPGFQKEHLKVTTEGLNIVRVRGERWIAENKWSRFQEDYRVPENCKMGGIRAKFDSGILSIIMPREINNAPPPPLTTTQLPPKINEPFEKTKQEELLNKKEETKEKKPDKPQPTPSNDYTLPPPPSTTTTTTDTQLPPKTKEQPFKRTKQEVLPKPKEESKEKKPDKPQSTPLKDYKLPPPPKPTSSSTPIKQESLNPSPKEKESIPKYALKQDKHYVDEKPNIGEKKDLDKRKETLLEKETKGGLEGSNGTPNYIEPKDNKKVVASRWMSNEDRKALVNVGVGVLVIVALGVHVSYNIGLISKG